MEVKQIISISPVSRPTWAKMCTAVKSPDHILWDRDEDDWWYVEVVQWANVIWREDNGDEYPAIFGCCMATEANVGLDFVETYEGFLTYTTEQPAYMDCVDARDGSDIKKTVRSDRFAPVLKEDLVAALKKARGNKKIAAKLLGINRTTIFRIIDKYGLKDGYIKEYNKQ